MPDVVAKVGQGVRQTCDADAVDRSYSILARDVHGAIETGAAQVTVTGPRRDLGAAVDGSLIARSGRPRCCHPRTMIRFGHRQSVRWAGHTMKLGVRPVDEQPFSATMVVRYCPAPIKVPLEAVHDQLAGVVGPARSWTVQFGPWWAHQSSAWWTLAVSCGVPFGAATRTAWPGAAMTAPGRASENASSPPVSSTRVRLTTRSSHGTLLAGRFRQWLGAVPAADVWAACQSLPSERSMTPLLTG